MGPKLPYSLMPANYTFFRPRCQANKIIFYFAGCCSAVSAGAVASTGCSVGCSFCALPRSPGPCAPCGANSFLLEPNKKEWTFVHSLLNLYATKMYYNTETRKNQVVFGKILFFLLFPQLYPYCRTNTFYIIYILL